jgi:hypothetical protein
MASDAQIRANRKNAQRSTGARTPEGKQRSKFNALKHGLTSVHVVLPWEEDMHYQELRGVLLQQYQPENATETFLVDQVAQNWWRLNRARRVETGTLAALGPESHLPGPTNADLDHLRRYEAAIERAFYRAYDRIEKIVRRRPAPPPAIDDEQPDTYAGEPEQTPAVNSNGFVSPPAAVGLSIDDTIGFVSQDPPRAPQT